MKEAQNFCVIRWINGGPLRVQRSPALTAAVEKHGEAELTRMHREGERIMRDHGTSGTVSTVIDVTDVRITESPGTDTSPGGSDRLRL